MSQDRRNPATSALWAGGSMGGREGEGEREEERGRRREGGGEREGFVYDSYSLLSHCHSTAAALEDFRPAVGSPDFISSPCLSLRRLHSLSASSRRLLLSLCFYFTL